ncbi:hypothetical protein LTR84_006530 [Exophiala bonariae]|uniref:DNA-directed RNA polymerase subunit n=1 Tax=Exophiala bonariae TaxID=1690606 RepID=A0AAV9N1I9_9EURO|nr:hypothetical protein LTR84_006530 [Exophiala bonariae]
MSVQVNGHKGEHTKDPISLTTPKKRKHDAESKESSKKKKRQRTGHAESPAAATPPVEDGLEEDKKNKKDKKLRKEKKEKKRRAKETELSENETDPEPPVTDEDVNFVDAPEEQQQDEDAIEFPTAAEGNGLAGADVEQVIEGLLESEDPTSFYSTRISLYISIPAIGLETAGSSVLATHIAPLLLTYFPPAKGIVLGFSDPILSAKPGSTMNIPLTGPHSADVQEEGEILARTSDELGVSWAWLTVTLLVFRPERGDPLHGWTNVSSEGFVGLVSYNYFQTAVGSSRIPADWKWNGPTREDMRNHRKKGRKGRLGGDDGNSQDQTGQADEPSYAEVENDLGTFTHQDGTKVDGTLHFRVVDTEVVPAHDRHKWSLQIDGTLLDDEAEEHALSEDRAKFERTQQHTGLQLPGDGMMTPLMSGARVQSREESVMSRTSRILAT